ncbi:uncharacterized protein LOC132749035 [Ruditapes philippinarum]|uniref:uncharacterized protein LOC132749035 n=1 Tax=Ruditapes philippinarum TaxID=129788 RepID=UPI00295AF680|nr:uncharacterized protein LOC132749035 [Ruditapes philippinarum]
MEYVVILGYYPISLIIMEASIIYWKRCQNRNKEKKRNKGDFGETVSADEGKRREVSLSSGYRFFFSILEAQHFEMSEIIEPSCEEIERPLFPQLIVVDKVKRSIKGSLSK